MAMTTDPRIFSILDDFDDFPFDPFDPNLFIPPLSNPAPLEPLHRPSPLEPTAHVTDGTKSATAKLTSRSKALATAKSIGEEVSEGNYNEAGPRKRQKREFVQLPKPKSRVKATRPRPFEPVTVLNELNEPPPSAAQFAPIVPNLPSPPEEPARVLRPLRSKQLPENIEQVQLVRTESSKKARGKRAISKRAYNRERIKWSEDEISDLLKGIGIYGVGKWKKILTHPGFSFLPERTYVDLKDR